MFKLFNIEPCAAQGRRHTATREYRKIRIQSHHWLDVMIHSQPADQTKRHARLAQCIDSQAKVILPADQSAARRLTYAPLEALARKTNVKMVGRKFDVEPLTKKTRLGLLKVHTQWLCDYESFRQFVYAFESASPFVIIDEVSLQQNDPSRPLSLVLDLSTYYRLSAHGN